MMRAPGDDHDYRRAWARAQCYRFKVDARAWIEASLAIVAWALICGFLEGLAR